jgi:hypothetical protein
MFGAASVCSPGNLKSYQCLLKEGALTHDSPGSRGSTESRSPEGRVTEMRTQNSSKRALRLLDRCYVARSADRSRDVEGANRRGSSALVPSDAVHSRVGRSSDKSFALVIDASSRRAVTNRRCRRLFILLETSCRTRRLICRQILAAACRGFVTASCRSPEAWPPLSSCYWLWPRSGQHRLEDAVAAPTRKSFAQSSTRGTIPANHCRS